MWMKRSAPESVPNVTKPLELSWGSHPDCHPRAGLGVMCQDLPARMRQYLRDDIELDES